MIVGHVDHGKSTLVGRLFHDTGSLEEGKFEAIEAMCKKRGVAFEWAFLMDALQAERDQGITIDTSQIWFKTKKRDYTIIDAPGHKEFLKNMVTGAAQSDAALLVIDALEGVQEQSCRHGYLLHLMGVKQIAVAVNKMDAVHYDEARFRKIEKQYRAYLASIGVKADIFIPVSAKEGDGISALSENMSWYKGKNIVEALDSFKSTVLLHKKPLRLPVQDIYKFDERRIIAGRIETGSLAVGDEIVFLPSNKKAEIAGIEEWPKTKTPPLKAEAGQSVGISLKEQIFVERGELVSHEKKLPLLSDIFRARVFWLGHKPLREGNKYHIKLGTTHAQISVERVERVIDTGSLKHKKAAEIKRNQVGEVVLRARRVLSFDDFADNQQTGRFVLIDGYDIAGGGILSLGEYPDMAAKLSSKSKNLQSVSHALTGEERAERYGHKSGVLWFTGLSGSGKSTLAVRLEQELFRRGFVCYVLDGDNIRQGLNANLGFSPDDRSENIRRVSEVAALFAQAGLIVITAFISPYRSDRAQARSAGGKGFREIYLSTDLKTCEKRDPKGLYKKARAGKIKEFTGLSAPYEQPLAPDLAIDTGKCDIDDAVERLIGYVEGEFR